MKHIPFDIICKIADGELSQKEIELYINHWKSCQTCQKETELQRLIMKASHKTIFAEPSNNFTQNILDIINPSQKKKWAEWLLHNMGNIIAMALVLTFLGYILSIAEINDFQNEKSANSKPVTEFVQIIQKGSNEISNCIKSIFSVQSINTVHANTIAYALLAIILLVLIDHITSYFLRQLKPKL
jgi:hypothetical protein